MRPSVRALACALLGLAAGIAAATIRFPGYRHAQVAIGRGSPNPPIRIDGRRRQFLALSVTDAQNREGIEVRMQDAAVSSWFPPVLRIPLSKAPSFRDGKFQGAAPGRRVPVYVSFDADPRSAGRTVDFLDAGSGELIESIALASQCGGPAHEH